MLALESQNSHRQTRTAHRQQQREESAKMELGEEVLTEEQLHQMTEFHSKNQTSRFTPFWIKSAATHGGAGARTHGGSMCATIGDTRSS